MNSYLHMIFDVLTLLWAKKVTGKTRSRMCKNPTGFLIWLKEKATRSLYFKRCAGWWSITKKTPISNIKGSLFCTRMSGNPGRIKRTDIIQEKCFFYRYTDRHGARRQRKKTGEQWYSERLDRCEVPRQQKDVLLQTWRHPADWATRQRRQ